AASMSLFPYHFLALIFSDIVLTMLPTARHHNDMVMHPRPTRPSKSSASAVPIWDTCPLHRHRAQMSLAGIVTTRHPCHALTSASRAYASPSRVSQ
ncbi:hypothetical protein B0H13DRAFT_1960951, partial [Mycena leptocephala]